MRGAKIAFVAPTVLVMLGGIWLAFAWRHPPTLVPAASISLIGYTSFTMSNPDTNVFVYPGRGGWLRAQMRLTNEGAISISYAAWGDEPYGWATVQTDQGMTNGYLAPRFTGGIAVLRPGSAATFDVFLPTNTLQWQCGFDIATASVRERAIWRVLESKFYGRFSQLCFYPLRFLPDRTGPRIELKSQFLEVTNSVTSPHTY